MVYNEGVHNMGKELTGIKSRTLVPTASNMDAVMDMLIGMVSKYGVRISKMMNDDSVAFEVSDMRWFGKEWFGRIPSWTRFVSELKKISPDAENMLRYAEAEALGERYESEMVKVLEKDTEDFDGSENKRFNWGEKLYKIQERKLARLDEKNKGGVKEGIDLAIKVIQSLSDAQLMRAKKVLDAEWTEVGKGRE